MLYFYLFCYKRSCKVITSRFYHFTFQAAHYFWGVWALLQASFSDIDFDFLGWVINTVTSIVSLQTTTNTIGVRSVDSHPEKEFLENLESPFDWLGIPILENWECLWSFLLREAEKLLKSRKNDIACGLFSKTRKRGGFLAWKYSEFSWKIWKIFLFRNRVNRTHPRYVETKF